MKHVIYILSLSHSGSTILGNFLGGHSRMIHLGEIVVPLRKGLPLKCYHCDDTPCPIWDSLISKKTIKQCYQSFISSQNTSRFIKKIRKLLHLNSSNPQSSQIYREIFFKDDVEVLIDSSKSTDWLLWNSNAKEFKHKAIFLTRDLRGVVASRKRKYNDSVDTIRNDIHKEITELIRQVGSFTNIDVLQLRYEDLITSPTHTAKQLSQFCGVPFDEDMLQFYEHPSHIVGGNIGPSIATKKQLHGADSVNLDDLALAQGKGYYLSVSPGLRLDERWKTELTSQELSLIDKTLGAINTELGYT